MEEVWANAGRASQRQKTVKIASIGLIIGCPPGSLQALVLHLLAQWMAKTGRTFVITVESRLESVESTMDAARALAAGQDFLLVAAKEQTQGKGTRGREWRSAPGNIYMTVGAHRRHLPPSRLALLPLELGLHVWEECAERIAIEARPSLRLKWPNDLLWRGRKAGGILIESHGEYLMAGIGLNLAHAPAVSDGGAPSACLAEAGVPPQAREELIEGIYRRFREAPADEAYDSENLLLRWQAKIDWERLHRLRERPGTPEIKPVSVNAQGHLLVRHGDGKEEWLVSEYLA
jgi:BirA family biotin operon repressor/biotin-[acetyl-CoA-carboxylase] ligase